MELGRLPATYEREFAPINGGACIIPTSSSHEFPGKYFHSTGNVTPDAFLARDASGQNSSCYRWRIAGDDRARARISSPEGAEERRPLRSTGAQQHSLGSNGFGPYGGRAGRCTVICPPGPI